MIRSILFLAALSFSVPAQASEADNKREVLAAVQGFFDALAAKDEGRLMAAVMPEGRISSQRTRDGVTRMRTLGWAEWAKSVAGAPDALEETMHGPKVRVKGTVASVWTYYTFRLNGKFSHCGIDVFDMAKLEGRWKIVNISYTSETEGCRKR